METKQEKRKTFLRKIAFASGDLFGGGSFNIINFLYPGFLALVVGINPFWSSFIMIVSRIYNVLIDPFIGWLSDRTNSRFGKRRLYFIVSAPLVVVGLFLMFYPFNFQNQTYQVIAVFLSYIIFVSVQSLAMIPYFSLSSEIASDYQERASFNTYRLAFSIAASIICVALPGLIVNSFDTVQTGYKVMSLTFGTLFGISLLFSGFFAKEEIVSPPVKAKFNFKTIFEPLKSKPFRQYLYLMFISAMTLAVMSGMFIFFVNFYVIKDLTFNGVKNNYATFAATIMLLAQIIALPIFLKVIEKRGKTFTYRLGAIIWIAISLPIFLIPANIKPIYLFVLAALLGIGMSAPGLVPHTMFGDVADAAQLQFKKRIEGQMSGLTNFVDQIGQGLGLATAMFILGLAKFQEQDLLLPPIREQPESALVAIRTIMSVTPLILLTIGTIVTLFYKIDVKEQKRIKEEIALLERK
ncbi:MAG TPA: MFS transporter [Candidatus Paceibacterota bacterium]|nr:MFS transporter [Candidatus Paceibacterota bacterium]